MNSHSNAWARKSARGFTLIELLVVIAIIALLAGLIFPITGVVNRQKIRAKARGELNQVETMIKLYKEKLGHYPPSSTSSNVSFSTTPLYYELSGTTLSVPPAPIVYQTLDEVSTITPAQLSAAFGVDGLVNSMQGAGSDEGRNAERFTTGLKANQVGLFSTNSVGKILVCTVGWKNVERPILTYNPTVTPFFYNSLNPTNNPNSYDLWVDVIVGEKTNRISNWSKEPIIP